MEEPKKDPETEKFDKFIREYYPGQPFRDPQIDDDTWLEYTPKSLALNEGEGYEPIVVCTPSLRDYGTSTITGCSLVARATRWMLVATLTAALTLISQTEGEIT